MKQFLKVAIFSLVLLILSACAHAAPQGSGDELRPWQILAVAEQEQVSFDAFASRVAEAEVVYLGEAHQTPPHIEAALRILRDLLARGLHPVLGLEMLSWNAQAAIDRYLADPSMARETFLEQSHWHENWGGSFDDYEPLLRFAQAHHLKVLALNPPRPVVREVVTRGLAEVLADPSLEKWGFHKETWPDDPAYRDVIMEQIQACHQGMSQDTYERVYEASVFRDEAMAKTIADALRQTPEAGGPFVSYTGGGHIQYGVPVPKRVRRRMDETIRDVTVYLHAFVPERRDELRELLDERIADYLWLTPPGPQGPPKRCG